VISQAEFDKRLATIEKDYKAAALKESLEDNLQELKEAR
jgi:hypothetical protein